MTSPDAHQIGKALSEAEKPALLARGEPLVAGAVGNQAASMFLTKGGRGLANVHDGTAPLNAGHSLRFGAPLGGKPVELPTGIKLGGGPPVLLHDVDRQWVVWTGKAPWTGAAPNRVRGAAVGGATATVVCLPDVLADLGTP